MSWRSYVGKGRPASFQAVSASGHIIAMRSSGVVTALTSSADSSPSAKHAIGHVARAARRLASEADGSGCPEVKA